MLAMDANDNACCLNDRDVPGFFASRLAPTGDMHLSIKNRAAFGPPDFVGRVTDAIRRIRPGSSVAPLAG